MKITPKELRKVGRIDKGVILSLDMSLYQVSVIIGGDEYRVVENGRYLRSHSIFELQHWLSEFSVAEVVLRHSSAYDEMVGQPTSLASNVLEVPLAGEDWQNRDRFI